MPLLRVLVLAFAIANASGLIDVALGSACDVDCAERDWGRDCDGGCPPICPTCHCAVRSPVAVAAAPACLEPVRAAVAAPFPDRERDPAVPDPREILHVPRSLLDLG